MRVILLCVGLVLVLTTIALITGDAIWSIGGTTRLDIQGHAQQVTEPSIEPTTWAHYGGDAGGSRYANLSQINTTNVANLEIAWRFSTGDLSNRPAHAVGRMAAQGTPILVGDLLVFCTPFNEVIALNPRDGKSIWRYDPQINLNQDPANQFVCRGVAYGVSRNGEERIYSATNDGRVIALRLTDGKPAANFGIGGSIDVDVGMPLRWPGEFQFTSPPVVANNTVIVGSAIGDNARVAAPRGVVRAYDATTGALRWTFDPIPRTQSTEQQNNARDWPAGAVPQEGHANAWAPLAVDRQRGLVFVPTSSPSPDFYGGLRPGDNRHANSVVALEIDSGNLRWAFQTVHHDVWDYDLPAQPGLYTITTATGPRDVVAQVTKTGLVFVLDRDSGEPVHAIEERPVPQLAVAGESLSATQPFPTKPAPLVPTSIDRTDAWGVTGLDKWWCARAIADADSQGLFTAPTERGTLFAPFTGGGANWGGPAFDATRNLLVVNMNNLVHHIQLIPAEDVEETQRVLHDEEVSPQTGAPFGMKRELLFSPLGLPCNQPPWGLLAAVDLASGDIVWRRTLGTIEDLTAGALTTQYGTPNVGGPMLTAGGLIFIGAAMDNYLRAFDTATGEALWQGRLDAGVQATPMTYAVDGRQFVVIYAGGHSRFGTTLGDEVVAFALPPNNSL